VKVLALAWLAMSLAQPGPSVTADRNPREGLFRAWSRLMTVTCMDSEATADLKREYQQRLDRVYSRIDREYGRWTGEPLTDLLNCLNIEAVDEDTYQRKYHAALREFRKQLGWWEAHYRVKH
jgi:hypothetical protein